MISGSYFLQKNVEGSRHLQEVLKKQPASMRQPVSHLRLESFLYMSEDTLQKCKVSREDDFWMDKRISALYFTEEGGILSGLWKMAEASGVGLDVDLRRIPIRQETIEVCERLDVDPYKLESEGTVLLGTGQGDALVRELEARGIHAAVIGHTDKGNDRLLHSGEITRYLERPRFHHSGKEKKHGKA